MKTRSILARGFLALVVAWLVGVSLLDGQRGQDERQSEPATSLATPTGFVPTEKVSAEQAVAFPTDI